MKTELILLAAGKSKRFGGIKQLADIDGQPMLNFCLAKYRQDQQWLDGIAEGHIVLGSNAESIRQVIHCTANIIEADAWHQGMGRSLAQSIQVIAKDTTHVLIALADQVLLSQLMIEQLLTKSKHSQNHIVAAKYANRAGVPAIFPRQYFTHLSRLKGDNGAKTILSQHQQHVVEVEMPEAAFDIDTSADLALFRSKLVV